MQSGGIIDTLSERAPSLVVLTLCGALLLEWFGAPLWLPNSLAAVVAGLSLLLFASRVRRREPANPEEDESWLSRELAGKGTPPGYYVLLFFSLVTIVLTGFQGAYAWPAWAAFALGIVWGLANRPYTMDEEVES